VGSATLTYQWQATNNVNGFTNLVNGGIISGATSNVLTLSSVTLNNTLAYQVIVSNGAGSVTSTPAANLTVLNIPEITNQPASQSTLSGGTATFTVGATGVGTLTYQWQATNNINGFTNLSNGGIISGATNSTLTLTGVTTNNALVYQVIVANANGSVTSSPVTLTVNSATRLIDVDLGTAAGVQSGAAVLGESGDVWNGVAGATATTIVDSSSNLVSGAGLTIGGANYFNYNEPGGTAMDAATTNLMQDFCFYYDGAGGHPNITVSVTGLTEYTNSPFELVVYGALGGDQGDTLTLTGATGGNTTSTLATSATSRQLSKGVGVAYQVFTGTLTNGTLTVVINTNLNIFYGCNGLQLLLSPTLPPLIATNPAGQLVTSGNAVTLNVGVLGTAPFGYQWLATNNVNGFTNLVNGSGITGATSNVLSLSSVTANNALVYEVVVTNAYGTATSAPAILSVLPGPTLVGRWIYGTADNAADISGFQPAGTHDGYAVGTEGLAFGSLDSPKGDGDALTLDGAEAVGISNSVSSDAGYQPTFDLYLTNSMTVAFWAQGYPTGTNVFVAKGGYSSAGWDFGRYSNYVNDVTFTLQGTADGVTTFDATPTNNINDGNWHHYAGTWDGNGGVRKVYVDGVLVTNVTADYAPFTAAGAYRLLLGGQDTLGTGDGNISSTTFFTGNLYDVRVYNYAIPASLVQQLAGITNVATVSSNAYLASLALSPAGTLSPAFTTNGFSYTATEAYGNTVTVTVTNADLTATNVLIYNGATNALASGVASSALSLNANPAVTNVVKVQVTAQDGVTVQTYVVDVTELPTVSSKPELTNSVSGSTLNLKWGLNYLGYRLLVQTNNLNKGVSKNAGDWGTVANSTATNTATISLTKTNANEYYKLVYP
jgi:hypothetical protein